jgi:hypothetical protein
MENKINTKINFKNVAIISLGLMVLIFIVRNFLNYFFTGNSFLNFGILESNSLLMAILYNVLYYYVFSFITFSVFVYIKNSLPASVNKSALIFALILFLVGNAPLSLANLFPAIFPNPTIFQPSYSSTYILNLVSGLLSILATGYFVSYSFEKFYKK